MKSIPTSYCCLVGCSNNAFCVLQCGCDTGATCAMSGTEEILKVVLFNLSHEVVRWTAA
ncbi:hypothetical protein DPMN_152866 [Dreissena polymorpha]|uniref:Uncharacterized protein n=1 Tax=Dreissena polymorpha TaxID=45954 RepID=A0A9D4FMP0_DREPO|nr:hypothetical protein DPMN_152866 [Dreissena polymorpha]